MKEKDSQFVKQCVARDIHDFYNSPQWRRLRAQVLQMDKGECQRCKEKGRYTKATTVHHVNYVKTHPELALEIYYTWQGKRKRNLLSLCRNCHEEVHGYRKPKEKKLLTEERWD